MIKTLVILGCAVALTAFAHVVYLRDTRVGHRKGADAALHIQTIATVFLAGYAASAPGAWS